MRHLHLITLAFATLSVGIFTLNGQEKSSFRLPGGDAEMGSKVFTQLNCVKCHSVKGVSFTNTGNQDFNLTLAGEERFVKNYEDLLKAISNPAHVIQKRYANILSQPELQSLKPYMDDFTDKMTLRQFMDLTAFLDEAYSAALESYNKAETK